MPLRMCFLYFFTSLGVFSSEFTALAFNNDGNARMAREITQRAADEDHYVPHGFDVLSMYSDGLRRMLAV